MRDRVALGNADELRVRASPEAEDLIADGEPRDARAHRFDDAGELGAHDSSSRPA